MSDWPLWEVFVRTKGGLAHRHFGSVHAPDAEMALRHARDTYTRAREEMLEAKKTAPREPSQPGALKKVVNAGSLSLITCPSTTGET